MGYVPPRQKEMSPGYRAFVFNEQRWKVEYVPRKFIWWKLRFKPECWQVVTWALYDADLIFDPTPIQEYPTEAEALGYIMLMKLEK